MHIGYIGLGKMGAGMTARLTEKGHTVTAYDPSEAARSEAANTGVLTVASLEELALALPTPKSIWLMVPHSAVEGVLSELVPFLSEGDTVIDGGNSPYKESIRRAEELAGRGIHFLDAGISGGPEGAREGACVMVGGEKDIFTKHEELFRDIALPEGYLYAGRSGAGHYVKMVHNGIEYGMMQSIAEGFAVMKASDLDLDLTAVAKLYNHGSVIESRLVEWLANAYTKRGEDLPGVSGTVAHSGEGLWTVEEAERLGIDVPVIQRSLEFRVESETSPSYTGQVLSALRNEFGGHDVETKKG